MDEFSLINKYFTRNVAKNDNVVLGIGDDCALFNVGSEYNIAVSTDTFSKGIHFFEKTDPYLIGHKALAVNLSDLAAMGAECVAYTVALSIPSADETFLDGFTKGLFDLATKYNIPLIGGDTTKGELAIIITVFGKILKGCEFRRDNAMTGELICVSGTLGDANLACKSRYEGFEDAVSLKCHMKLDKPEPRLDMVAVLKNLGCRCAMDLSDGLMGDIKHILKASKCCAQINIDKLPLSSELKDFFKNNSSLVPNKQAYDCALQGGDDYELLFTLSKEAYNTYLQDEGLVKKFKIYSIGEITERINDIKDEDSLVKLVGCKENITTQSFTHF